MNDIMHQLSELKKTKPSVVEIDAVPKMVVGNRANIEMRVNADEERVNRMERHLADLTNRRLDYLEMMQHKQMDVQVRRYAN